MTIKDRFETKFERRGPGECWPWRAGLLGPMGYGKFWIADGGSGKTIAAHRVSYQLYVGETPSGLVVRHRCDNPPCVNPAHLQLGTNRENIQDRNLRGRQARGERLKAAFAASQAYRETRVGEGNPKAKLTAEAVLAIRSERNHMNTRLADLAARYGVSKFTIADIVRGKTWRHLAGEAGA